MSSRGDVVLEVSAESDTRGLLAEDSTAPRPAAAGGGGVDRNNGGHSRHLEDDGAEGSAAAAASRQRPEDSSGQQDDEDEYIIVVQNVHKTYLLGVEGVAALRGVSTKVKRGELVMLFGTSGGGKSTLLNIIGTIDKPTKGNVFVCGTRICDSTTDNELAAIRLNKLGFVFQTFNLIAQLTALENVELPLALQGSLSASDRRKRATQLLEAVGMGERTGHLPSELSGGEQQRVTIARALVNWPDVLLLDEPTGDLDTRNSDMVMRILLELNRKHGITMVIVTHDVHLRGFADRILHLRDGKMWKEEVMDQDQRSKNVAELFGEGLGDAALGQTSLREGARGGRRGGGEDVKSVFRERGLEASECNMTLVREPGDYATHEALRWEGRAESLEEGSGEGGALRRRIAFHAEDSFVTSPAVVYSP